MLQLESPVYGVYILEAVGASVAIWNNYLIVGGPYSYENWQQPAGPLHYTPNKGIFWIWKKNTDAWDVVLSDYTGGADCRLGSSVAIDGNTVVVGEPGGNEGKGAAHVYVNSAYATTLLPLYGTDGEEFGCSVAVSGNTVVVGHYKRGNRGKAYVYVKPASGWASVNPMTPTCQLFAIDWAAGDEFGCSVAVDGDTVAVGARAKDDSTGAAYVFVKPENGWPDALIHNAKLTASSQTGAIFGYSVAIQGDRVLVGSPGLDVLHGRFPSLYVAKDQGSVSLFVKPAGGWSGNINRTQFLTSTDGASGDSFGCSVSIDGEIAVVGATGTYGPDGVVGSNGAVYVFDTYSQISTTSVPQSSTTSTAGETSITTTSAQTSSTTTAAQASSTTTTIAGGDITVDFTASQTRGFAPLEVHFSNASTGSIAGYEWTFGDGTASLEKNPTHAYPEKGIYSVILTADGQDGNSYVKMKKRYIRVFPNIPCIASSVFKDRDDILHLKHVRDSLLNKPAGMMLVYLYYQHSAAIGDIIAKHPELVEKLQKLIHENVDLVQAMANGEPISVSDETVQSAMSILWEIRDSSGVELTQSINLLLAAIKNGYLLNAPEIGLE